eukprot:TRINITY_DN58416_c0_g1_i1.p1 TRINITY_DN58416_c0_g1~~TRINITY_DN58416_c0_g1_i1.p1  ORF type:complete len:516 (+),score=52.57 TRINITY_DN58416_c0_g1_i1:63-1610(+)
MSSTCNTPRVLYCTADASIYDYGEHAGGANTPPAFAPAHASFLVLDLKGRLANLKAAQLERSLPDVEPAYLTTKVKGQHLSDPIPAVSNIAPPPGLAPRVRWDAAVVTPGMPPVPPPPQPHPVERLPSLCAPNRKLNTVTVTSLGTVGHPLTCAPACKYVKRQGGCREGASCTQCHDCFWTRLPSPGYHQKQNLAGTCADQIGETSTSDRPGALRSLLASEGAQEPAHSLAPACEYFQHKQSAKFEQHERGLPETDPARLTIQVIDQQLLHPIHVGSGVAPPPGPATPPQWDPAMVTSGVPPTPQQHLAMRPPTLCMQAKKLNQVASLGTLGHPLSCAPPCKYVKRQGGCREGVNCTQCHECFWTRQPNPRSPQNLASTCADMSREASKPEISETQPTSSLIISVGTQGHPYSCAPACKYLKRKNGCTQGLACTQCHACTWHRRRAQDVHKENSLVVPAGLKASGVQESKVMTMPPGDLSVEQYPSISSWGAPMYFDATECNNYDEAVIVKSLNL